jgi:hypothetical protein
VHQYGIAWGGIDEFDIDFADGFAGVYAGSSVRPDLDNGRGPSLVRAGMADSGCAESETFVPGESADFSHPSPSEPASLQPENRTHLQAKPKRAPK